MMAFCPEHPKWDQNPKFTPPSETTSIPTPFTCGVPPPGGFNLWFGKHGMLSMLGFFVAAISTLRAVPLLYWWLLAFMEVVFYVTDMRLERLRKRWKPCKRKPLLATTGTLFHKEILVRLHYAACLRKKSAPGGERWEATVFAVYRSNKLLLFRSNVIVTI